MLTDLKMSLLRDRQGSSTRCLGRKWKVAKRAMALLIKEVQQCWIAKAKQAMDDSQREYGSRSWTVE